jgi:hypothetical protein
MKGRRSHEKGAVLRERERIRQCTLYWKRLGYPEQVARRIARHKPYSIPDFSSSSRRRYERVTGKQITPCRCWNPHCPPCMRSFQSTMDMLDRMILMGWGDTPQYYIPPAKWRKMRGPGTIELVKPDVLASLNPLSTA